MALTPRLPVFRRDMLHWLGSACLVAAGVETSNLAYAQPLPGLDVEARRSGRRLGFAIDPAYADKEPVKSLLEQHAGVITAENAMKWRSIEGILGFPDYSRADRVVEMAANLHAELRGHTLAWHQSTPAYLANVTPQEFVRAQTAHLQAMAQRYAGRIHTWDVLNEAVDAESKRGDGLRESVLSKLWGTDQYPALFELARAADPHAKLACNDYGMEQDEPWCERRRSAVLTMLEEWVRRKTPVDVMGLQAHLDTSRRFSATKLSNFFDELRALGLCIQITELDVRDTQVSGSLAERDAEVASLYRDFMETCVDHPSVEMVVLWNVTDADSWVNRMWQGQRRVDGQPMRPTLFDPQGQAKAAFNAVATSLRSAQVKFDHTVVRPT